jgi:hypothetical protein
MNQTTFCQKLLFLILGLALVSCGVPKASDHKRDVANLPKVFPILRTLKVKDYRNQDWCKNVAYQRGKFSSNLESTTCNLFDGTPKPMDQQTLRDFQAIANSMATTSVSIHFLSAQYNSSNQLVKAEFHLATTCRCSYVYIPQYKQLPENMTGEIEYTAINSDWYFVWEDWN